MKKYNKLVVSLVLGASVVATFGTAFALYKNVEGAKDYSIGIGSVQSHTDSDDNVTYKIGTLAAYKDDALSNAYGENEKLSPDSSKVYLKVPLSFEYKKTETTSAQETAVGRFSVSVTVNDKIAAITDGAKVEAKLVGYNKVTKDGSEQVTYFTSHKLDNFVTGTFGSDKKTITGFIDTAVDASSIYCVVTLDFSSACSTADNYLAVAEVEKAFTASLSWSPYDASKMSDFDTNLIPSAYVRGDKSDWKSYSDYQMVPNINAAYDIVEWHYKLLKDFSKIKVYDANETVLSGGGWIKAKDGVATDSEGNATLNKDKSYNVYYTRNETYTYKQGFYVEVASKD